MKWILISRESGFDETLHLSELFNARLDLFHLRKPGFSEQEMCCFIEKVPVKFRSRLVLHSHFHLCEVYSLSGIHLSDNSRNRFSLRNDEKLPGNCLILSASFHKLVDLHRPVPACDYVFFSPVFKSLSKSGYHPAYALDDIFRAVQLSPFNVVALGGMDAGNVKKALDGGFSGCAFKGAVWNADDPVAKWKQIVSKADFYAHR